MPFVDDDPRDNPYAAPQTKPASWEETRPANGYTGYAGFWQRFVAHLVDSLALAALVIPIGLVFVAVMVVLNEDETDELSGAQIALMLVMYGLMFVAMISYYAVMESSKYQGTLGKMALGLKVTDQYGRRISFGRSLGRAAAKIFITQNTCAIGYIMVGFMAKKQALHDLIASTLVLKTRP